MPALNRHLVDFRGKLPAQSGGNMDIGNAFTYFTEDPQWTTKMIIGGLIVLLSPFLLFLPMLLLLGYEVAITRNVLRGAERPLPDWEDWGQFLRDGLNVAVAKLVYSAPLWLLFCMGMGVSVLPALSANNQDVAAALGGIAGLTWILLSCVLILLGLAYALFSPVINLQYVRTGELAACFRFAEVWALLRENLNDVFMAGVGVILANMISSLVISISVVTICGPFILSLAGPVWIRIVSGQLVGQIAYKLNGKAAPMPVM